MKSEIDTLRQVKAFRETNVRVQIILIPGIHRPVCYTKVRIKNTLVTDGGASTILHTILMRTNVI
jgi:peroxiredoxin